MELPKKFFWGTATSAHQTEGNNTRSDWWAWEQQGNIYDGSTSGKACNSWELFDKDLEAMRSLNVNAYRLSIEWAKVEPKPGKFDQQVINHYKEILQKLRKAGIEPFVTLHHFTNPFWIMERGGWEEKKNIAHFINYVEKIVEELSVDISYWTTINEPMVYAGNGWIYGEWPPEKNSFRKMRSVLNIMAKAHKQAYNIIHEKTTNKTCYVSIAKNNQLFESLTDSLTDRVATGLIDWYWNHRFLRKLDGHLDYIGLNFYFKTIIEFRPNLPLIHIANDKKPSPNKSDINWDLNPEALFDVLKALKGYKLPIIILENGLSDKKDKMRTWFITECIRAIKKATAKGIDVQGYFHWSLIDNFEWRHGYKPRFGLFAINYKTFERTPRPSAMSYRQICETNANQIDAGQPFAPLVMTKQK
jgi:beta-glucosidase